MLCVGEFFSPEANGNDELEAYRTGNKHGDNLRFCQSLMTTFTHNYILFQHVVAVPTYILGPNCPETSKHYDGLENGDICSNLTYLGTCFCHPNFRLIMS